MTTWQKLRDILTVGKRSASCHGEGLSISENGLKKVGIVGTPNVGKSVIFNSLTGAYVTVSNYPGTTVAVSRGKARMEEEEFEVMDTPGMYSLMPITEEERVARTMLLAEKPDVILHVVDARNLDRMLPLTVQLIEAGLPTMLDLNMMDETEAAGIEINIERLEEELGIPVVGTVATTGQGVEMLRKRLVEYARNQNCAQI